MQLREALGLLTATSAIVNLTGTEMVMLALPDEAGSDALAMTRIDLTSAAVREAFDFPHYQQDLTAVLDEITTYAEEHGCDDTMWEQLSI